MSNDDAINILSGNWGTAFTADDVPEIRRKAAAEARAALLAEVLAVVDDLRSEVDDYDNCMGLTHPEEQSGAYSFADTLTERLAALNQTENDEP